MGVKDGKPPNRHPGRDKNGAPVFSSFFGDHVDHSPLRAGL